MQNFVHLVGDPVARQCVVVDPAWEIDTSVDTAAADDMTLVGALVTHTHQDHVGGSLASWGMPGRIPGIEELLTRVPAKVYVHKAEREFLPGLGSDLVKVDNHDTLDVGRLKLTFLHTPGHTPGSQCFLAGVPCSLIEDLIAVLERSPRAPYVAAVREDAAIGVAAGAWFGGRRPAVLMQNSGLGTSLNALASLSLMYGLPLLLLITWRGFGGKDAPEHLLTGEITPDLLRLLRIPFRILASDSVDADVDWAAREMDEWMSPIALLVPPKVVETGNARSREGERVAGEGLAAARSRPTATAQPGDKSSTSDHRNYGRQREDGGRDRAGQAPLPLAPATMTRLT